MAPGDGAGRRLLVTRFPVFDGTGQPIGVGTIGTDVTERFLAEERLRHAQRMEAMMNSRNRIAHQRNEKSAHEPRMVRREQGEGHASHGHGHGHHHQHRHGAGSRPWMIGH